MKAKTIALLGLILTISALSLTACSSKENSAPQATESTENKEDNMESSTDTMGTYQKLTAEEAYARLNSGDAVTLVDVRTEEEFTTAHIKGALLIPNESIDKEPPALLPDKDAEILIYCRSGNRSKQAADKLLAMGYTNVYDFGGINDWTYETVTGFEESEPLADSEEPASFSNFTATDVDGNTVDQSIFADSELTMVNIWATFCGPCLREMPDLAEINADYKDKGFKIVGIVADANNGQPTVPAEQLETIKEIIDQTKADYLHLLPSKDLIAAKLNQVQAVPETVFVDKDGKIVGESYVGSRSKKEWTKIIDELLKD